MEDANQNSFDKFNPKEDTSHMKKTILDISPRTHLILKITIFFVAVGFLFMGKAFGVPDKSY